MGKRKLPFRGRASAGGVWAGGGTLRAVPAGLDGRAYLAYAHIFTAQESVSLVAPGPAFAAGPHKRSYQARQRF